MSDTISRQAAIKAAEKLLIGIKGIEEQTITENNVNYFCYEIMKLPSAQPMRKKGEWKRTYLDHVAMGERPSIIYCSVCGQCIAYPVNFCPNCGADMRGEQNDRDKTDRHVQGLCKHTLRD